MFLRLLKTIQKTLRPYTLLNQRIAMTYSTSQLNTQIKLNDTETKITSLLNEYTEHYNKTIASGSNSLHPLTLRITGGWVRDKLLGKESHDIDIGIDHLSGEEFVYGLKEYFDLKEAESAEKFVRTLYKIEKNPEKSKHLETCTTKILGIDIDFVNLRSEAYTEESRIPTIQTGTPEEDAFRRDATLNAMFYNLSTMEVEDLTGKGLQDLKNGILRTPLDPMKTFLDDPLRCLRLIRFASTYDFQIEEETLIAMKQQAIRDMLKHKISRERVGSEFRKIIAGNNPIYGLSLINEVNFNGIFDFGDQLEVEHDKKDDKRFDYAYSQGIKDSLTDLTNKLPSVAEKISQIPDLTPLMDDIYGNEYDKLVFFLSFILYRWKGIRVVPEKKPEFATRLIVMEGLKLPAKVGNSTSLITLNRDTFVSNFAQFEQFQRADIALKLIKPFGEHWKLNLLSNSIISSFENTDNLEEIFQQTVKLLLLCNKLGLDEVYNEKPLVDGKELMHIMERKGGAWLKKMNDELKVYQLSKQGITKEEMIKYAHKLKASGSF